MKKALYVLAATLLILVSGCQQPQITLFVSPSGNDDNPGTKEQPFATLEKATKTASAFAGKEAITIYLREGVHYITEPILLTSTHSGKKIAL